MSKQRFFRTESEPLLFSEQALAIAAALVSLFLQIISFFTTWDGAKAYFEATFAYAPLLFAVAVQTVVYFLENTIRRSVSFAKIVALTLAICCSSFFSFVGIYNNINSPYQYLEQTYSGYTKQLAAEHERLSQAGQDSYRQSVNSAVSRIVKDYTSLVSERATLQQLSEEIANTDAEHSYTLTPPKRSDYEEYEDYAAAYSAYIASISQGSTVEEQAQLTAILNKYGISDPSQITEKTAQLTSVISLIEGTAASYGGEAYSALELMRNRALAGDSTAAQRIENLYIGVAGEQCNIPEYSEGYAFALPEYSTLAGDSPAAVVRERLSVEISSAVDDINAVGGTLSADDYQFQNIYTLPIHAVISGDFGADALVSLLLAVLVDVLSLLFAMIFVRSKSVLAATSTGQAVSSNSALFEQNVITALRLGISAEQGGFAQPYDLEEITERLAEFINCFHAADHAAKQGYTLAADKASLGRFEALTAFLCQFGLARSVSAAEMKLLTGDESSTDSVLLKTKFLLWVTEKCGGEAIPQSRTAKRSKASAASDTSAESIGEVSA